MDPLPKGRDCDRFRKGMVPERAACWFLSRRDLYWYRNGTGAAMTPNTDNPKAGHASNKLKGGLSMSENRQDGCTLDERLRLPCGICGQGRNRHVGSVHGCFGGYGTYWNPDGEPDPRLIKAPNLDEAPATQPVPLSPERRRAMADDAELIAALRNAAPAILSALKAAQELVDDYNRSEFGLEGLSQDGYVAFDALRKALAMTPQDEREPQV